jgi:hypothetical protein
MFIILYLALEFAMVKFLVQLVADMIRITTVVLASIAAVIAKILAINVDAQMTQSIHAVLQILVLRQQLQLLQELQLQQLQDLLALLENLVLALQKALVLQVVIALVGLQSKRHS